jgi:putative endonuclease
MARHLDIGKKGENLAVQYLRDKNWKILERNWRSGHKEIDIIALNGNELVVVEVKVRKSIGAERLEEHLPRSKQQNLVRAAGAYLKWKNLDRDIRFDMILLTGGPGRYEVEHIENAFSAWD